MNQNQLKYIFKNFQLIYNWNDFENVSFGENKSAKIVILKGEEEISDSPIKVEWKGKNIPFLFNEIKKEEVITQKENQVIINYDIFFPIFYLLSGKQELDVKKRDKHNRFEYKNSVQYKFDFVEIPLVNYYFDILKSAIEMAYEIKIEFRNEFSTCLTHDIDEVNSAWKHRIRIALENKKYLKAVSFYLKHLIRPFYPWRNLDEILDLEKMQGVSSTFFFLTNNNKIGEIKNADYELKEKYIQKMFQNIKAQNSEIGLHGSYKTHDDSVAFEKDIKLLNQNTTGNRFHFLQWKMDKTPQVIEKSGLKYDTTLGFQEQIGFRNGICNPFYLYDFENEKAYDFLEIPLTIMDCSLAFKNYMGIEPKKVNEIINPILQEIKKFEGVLTINWHNTFFSDYTNEHWKEVYTEIIGNCKVKNSKFVACEQICESLN